MCQEAESRGENYDRVKMLEVTAEDADRLERKRKKKNPDQGFSGIAYILVLLYFLKKELIFD